MLKSIKKHKLKLKHNNKLTQMQVLNLIPQMMMTAQSMQNTK